MRRPARARLAAAVTIGLLVFLLGSMNDRLEQRDRRIGRLAAAQETVVATLAEILTRTIAAEQAALAAGQTPTVTVEAVLQRIQGLDRQIVDEALKRAQAATQGPPGPPGPVGPRGPAGTTSTVLASTTSTRPSMTTTSSTTTTTRRPTPSSTTTTTRPCAVQALGLRLVCP